jgi:peptide/nickel transport system permease protein
VQAYIIRRLFLILPTLFIASLIIFFMLRFIPGNVVDQMVGEHGAVTGMDRVAVERAMGLDVPVHIQYFRWLGVAPYSTDEGKSEFRGLLQGNLGTTLWKRIPVTEEIMARWPVTFELGILAIIIALLIAIPIGVFSAIRQDSAGDYIGRSFAILCLAIPGFWLGTMVMIFPSKWWGWSPPIILIPFVDDPLGNLGMFIVPALLMGLAMSGTTMRMTRSMMLEVLRQDYIRTAWSKGLKERLVVTRHALKNALIPVVTIIGFMMPVLIGGAVIMEQIFCLPGVGRLMVDAINQRDYPIVSGVMLFTASWVLIINLIVDLTYAYLDPRVQYK